MRSHLHLYPYSETHVPGCSLFLLQTLRLFGLSVTHSQIWTVSLYKNFSPAGILPFCNVFLRDLPSPPEDRGILRTLPYMAFQRKVPASLTGAWEDLPPDERRKAQDSRLQGEGHPPPWEFLCHLRVKIPKAAPQAFQEAYLYNRRKKPHLLPQRSQAAFENPFEGLFEKSPLQGYLFPLPSYPEPWKQSFPGGEDQEKSGTAFPAS